MKLATDKQISWLIHHIKSNLELRDIPKKVFEEVNGQKVDYTFHRLGKKLANITQFDAHLLINNIIDDNLVGVKRYIKNLY